MKKSTYVLGISAYYHDSAAAILRDGEIVAAAQEERFSRKKHDHRFPVNASRYCLEAAGIDISAVDYVTFYDKPFIKFERLLETYLAYAPLGIRSFLKAMPLWIKEKLWIQDTMIKELGFEGTMIFPEHHESHAAAAFYPSPFDRAAFLTIDGVGEWATTSFGTAHDNQVEIIKELHFPHSLGMLYSAFTYYTGFKVNSGEYKVMGLAPYGEPAYTDLILNELMDLKADGSFRLNMNYFNYCAGLTMTNRRFDKLFGGPPRRPESRLSQREMDLARSVQEATEEIMMRMVNHVHAETGETNLCLAGGVALNCVANGRILREGPFENIWIQPAAGDAGSALGAALYVWYRYLDNPRTVVGKRSVQKASYLGPSFSAEQIESFLTENGGKFTRFDNENELIDEVADLLANEKIVGWFSGRMEFGPRALGSRSILGDPRSQSMQSNMNLKIKFRESFRPFAPSVLEEKVSEFFEMDCASPYMLLVAPVAVEKRIDMTPEQKALFGIEKLNIPRSEIPAVTHVDYSARVQTVSEVDNGLYYKLIRSFYEKTGCPVLVNTSFNVRGEPIVCTPEDAYRCFMRTNMDYLVLDGFLVSKEDQVPLEDDKGWMEEFELD